MAKKLNVVRAIAKRTARQTGKRTKVWRMPNWHDPTRWAVSVENMVPPGVIIDSEYEPEQ